MMTETALKNDCMDCLVDNFGVVNAEKFILLINKEPFDYTKWRKDKFDNISREKLISELQDIEKNYDF